MVRLVEATWHRRPASRDQTSIDDFAGRSGWLRETRTSALAGFRFRIWQSLRFQELETLPTGELALESFDLDPNAMLAPIIIVSLCFAAVLWLAMLGGSLKFSLSLTVDDEPSYLRCLLMAIVIIINVGIAVAMYATIGPQPWYITAGYQTIVQVVLLMMLARCNPFAAFLASLAHSFFSGVGSVLIAIGMFVCCGSALVGLGERASARTEQHDDLATTSADGPIANPFFNDADG
jgi:hypothetical protein